MAISRFANSTIGNGFPKYQNFWDQVTPVPLPVTTNLKLWLDASFTSSITSSGGKVSQWNDLSGNNYHFTQSTGSAQPSTGTNTINSKNVLSFNGSSTALISNQASSVWKFLHDTTGSTIFIVGKHNSFSTSPGWMGTAGGTSDHGLALWHDTGGVQYVGIGRGVSGSWCATATGNTLSTGTNYYVTYKLDPNNGTASNRIKMLRNGANETGSNSLTNAPSSSNPTYTLYIGNDVTGQYLNGDIAEIIIYSGVLGSSDLTSIHNYLSTKWGI